jgi:hypothetical protein
MYRLISGSWAYPQKIASASVSAGGRSLSPLVTMIGSGIRALQARVSALSGLLRGGRLVLLLEQVRPAGRIAAERLRVLVD